MVCSWLGLGKNVTVGVRANQRQRRSRSLQNIGGGKKKRSVYFESNGPSKQWPFVFKIVGCRTNGLSVQCDIFQAIGVSE